MKTIKSPFIALLSSADYKTGRLSAVSIGSTTYGIIDNLTIAREGNKLKSVSDVALSPLVTNPTNFTDGATNTQEYAYDGRGNLTRDDNKGITSITYNPLNLPSVVTFSTGATIQYFYRSDGVKLRTIHTPSSGTATTTNYCSNLVYDGTTLKMMLFDGGYATMSGSFPTYHYYLRDHLGSNRVLVNADGTVEQLIHYYPYGGEWSDATGSDIQPYKYTGKELDKTFSMNLYDYGARHYDPSLCSWTGQDPLGDKYYGMSSYGFCGGNPVRMVDVDGMFITTHTDMGGKVIKVIENDDRRIYRHKIDSDIKEEDIDFLGGELMGVSLQIHSFSKGDIIDFDSQELNNVVETIIDMNPNLLQYAINAQATGIWDLKDHYKKGSIIISGTSNKYYASPRDAGNFLAGYMASKSGMPHIVNYGYGVYNLCDNNLKLSYQYIKRNILSIIFDPFSAIIDFYNGYHGEDIISQTAINIGKDYYNNPKKYE